MAAEPFPARLHVLFACDASAAVVWRRGPANAVCSIGWDRATDTFKIGQWLRGRVYERRSDLSPDGRYLIYFARGGRGHPETKGSWTAISRAPWLKAITLWGKGDTWQGGGLFTSNRRYWLNGCHFAVRESAALQQDTRAHPTGGVGAECLSVYFPRLLRDGWRLVTHLAESQWVQCTVFERDLPGGWVLRKLAYSDLPRVPGRGCYWDEHELERGRRRIECKQWEWADRDGDSVVWAQAGKLWRATLDDTGLVDARELYDFNPMRFEAVVAPY